MTNVPDYQFAVIIPAYNDRDYLRRCLDSLYGNPAGVSFKVVVVDDCSEASYNAQLDTWAHQLGFVLLRSRKQLRFTRTVNYGLQYAWDSINPYWYLLLNSDVYLNPYWGEAIMKTADDLKAGIVGVTLFNPDGTLQHLGAYGRGEHYDINQEWTRYREDRLVPWATGAAMAIHKRVIDTVGLLPISDTVKQYDASDRNYCVWARRNYGVEIALSVNATGVHDTHDSREMRLGRGHITPYDVV